MLYDAIKVRTYSRGTDITMAIVKSSTRHVSNWFSSVLRYLLFFLLSWFNINIRCGTFRVWYGHCFLFGLPSTLLIIIIFIILLQNIIYYTIFKFYLLLLNSNYDNITIELLKINSGSSTSQLLCTKIDSLYVYQGHRKV